jgi:hypothetical protein
MADFPVDGQPLKGRLISLYVGVSLKSDTLIRSSIFLAICKPRLILRKPMAWLKPGRFKANSNRPATQEV